MGRKNGFKKDKSSRELSIHTSRRVDHKDYIVNVEGKTHNGIYSIILCMHIKHGDIQRYEFSKHTCLFWSGYLCGGRGREQRLELVKDKTQEDVLQGMVVIRCHELKHMIHSTLHQVNKNQNNSNHPLSYPLFPSPCGDPCLGWEIGFLKRPSK